MLHLTLNTGHAARYEGTTPPEQLAAVRPLLRGGGNIPGRAPFRVETGALPGGMSFSIHRGADPITLNVLVWTAEAAAEAWPLLEQTYLGLADQHPGLMAATACPEMPAELPWLATVLLPALTVQRPEELRWIGAFERIFAEATLAAR
jgi:hypothetical protein